MKGKKLSALLLACTMMVSSLSVSAQEVTDVSGQTIQVQTQETAAGDLIEEMPETEQADQTDQTESVIENNATLETQPLQTEATANAMINCGAVTAVLPAIWNDRYFCVVMQNSNGVSYQIYDRAMYQTSKSGLLFQIQSYNDESYKTAMDVQVLGCFGQEVYVWHQEKPYVYANDTSVMGKEWQGLYASLEEVRMRLQFADGFQIGQVPASAVIETEAATEIQTETSPIKETESEKITESQTESVAQTETQSQTGAELSQIPEVQTEAVTEAETQIAEITLLPETEMEIQMETLTETEISTETPMSTELETESALSAAATQSGWVETAEGWQYYVEGHKASGWLILGSYIYYLDPENDNIMVTGFQTIEGNRYYFSSGGTMTRSKWVASEGFWYYMDPQGILVTNQLRKINKHYYYLGTDGKMLADNWAQDQGNWYYLKSDGTMAVLYWVSWNGHKYYLGADGSMQKGWQDIDGHTYFFNAGGSMRIGWLHTQESYYYLGTDGTLQLGWKSIGGKTYHFDRLGRMQSGFQTIDGSLYYFGGSNDGSRKSNVWAKSSSGDYYYLRYDGKAHTGWLTMLSGKSYHFDENGVMATGFTKIAGWTYYFGGKNDGCRRFGWQTINGHKYFFSPDAGIMLTGWQTMNGNKYYFDTATGQMTTGWRYLGSYKFYFNEEGIWQQNLHKIIGKQSSYYIKVDRTRCRVTVYAYDSNTGSYCIPVISFICSPGTYYTPTPAGTFRIGEQYRVAELMGPSWGQYASHVYGAGLGGIYFHSVAGSSNIPYNISSYSFNMLGQPASHGCIRLCVRDAKWIYDNCKSSTTVKIGDYFDTPIASQYVPQIPYGQSYDPTDPAITGVSL